MYKFTALYDTVQLIKKSAQKGNQVGRLTCSSENRINTDLADLAIGYFLRFLSKFLLYKEKKKVERLSTGI